MSLHSEWEQWEHKGECGDKEVSRCDCPANVFTCLVHTGSCLRNLFKPLKGSQILYSQSNLSGSNVIVDFSFYWFYLQFRLFVYVEELNQLREN